MWILDNTNIPGLQDLKSNRHQFAQQTKKKDYLEKNAVRFKGKKKLSQLNDSRIWFEHDALNLSQSSIKKRSLPKFQKCRTLTSRQCLILNKAYFEFYGPGLQDLISPSQDLILSTLSAKWGCRMCLSWQDCSDASFYLTRRGIRNCRQNLTHIGLLAIPKINDRCIIQKIKRPVSKILTTARSNSQSLHQEDYKFRTNPGIPTSPPT